MYQKCCFCSCFIFLVLLFVYLVCFAMSYLLTLFFLPFLTVFLFTLLCFDLVVLSDRIKSVTVTVRHEVQGRHTSQSVCCLCTCHDNSSISHNWFVVDHLFVIYFPFIPLDRLVVPLVDFNRLVVILCEWRVGRLTGWVHCMTVWMWLYLWSVWFCSLTVLYFINIIMFYFFLRFLPSFFQWEHEGVWRHL